jgi:hypothetical protein
VHNPRNILAQSRPCPECRYSTSL